MSKTYYHVFGRETGASPTWFHHFSADTREDATYERDYLGRSCCYAVKIVKSAKSPEMLLDVLNANCASVYVEG